MQEQESTLGKKLAVLAKLKGLTQEQIARSCSMSRISINRFFRSHTEIRASDLGLLLSALGINLSKQIDRAIELQMNSKQNKEGLNQLDGTTTLAVLNEASESLEQSLA